MKLLSHSSYLFVAVSLFLGLVVAACGGGGAAATAIPTSTQIPTYNFVRPTDTQAVATEVATSEAASTSEAAAPREATAVAVGLDPEIVTRGKGRYEALKCGDCHGADGAGTDKGVSLLTSSQSEADFITFIRSGGELGTEHQYPANRLSDSGTKLLYQYLLSLRKS